MSRERKADNVVRLASRRRFHFVLWLEGESLRGQMRRICEHLTLRTHWFEPLFALEADATGWNVKHLSRGIVGSLVELEKK